MKKIWKKTVAVVITSALLAGGITPLPKHAEAKVKRKVAITKKAKVTVEKTIRIKLKKANKM